MYIYSNKLELIVYSFGPMSVCSLKNSTKKILRLNLIVGLKGGLTLIVGLKKGLILILGFKSFQT